ncbi:TPA: hypothetical protein QEL68_000704 [Stenotrophomonas maltophilia]|nr:hypothetical protein [Stenotrophomonas maltophilia]
MRGQRIDLIGGFYKDDTLPWSCQDTVNWLPVRAEVPGTRSEWTMKTAPGLRESLWIGEGSAPLRGLYDLEGQTYFVSGQTLYRRRNDGGVDALGLIPGVGRVEMTHNQFGAGYQLVVENGQGGGGYVWDTTASTFNRITDEGYPGSISSDFLDQYHLGVEPQGRYWFHSELSDSTSYNTNDRQEAETQTDKIVGLKVSNNDVVVFGERSIDFFFNTGQATGTFVNRRQSITNRGCASRHTIQKLDNTLFWLGDDGIVYRLQGYGAVPVSTRVMDRAILGYNWSQAFAFTWEDNGFKCYVLTFPDGMTFSYDVISGLWIRRLSFGLNRWRLSHLVKSGGKWIGGDFQAGRLWEVDWNYFLEGQEPLIRKHVTGVVHDNQSQLIIPYAALDFATGTQPTIPQPPLPPVTQYPAGPSLTGTLATACAGPAYNATLTKTGASTPTTIRKSAGPADLTISDAGALNWPRPEVGTFNIVAQIRDAVGRTALWQGQLVIKPLTWNFTTWQNSAGYSSPYGVGQVIWSDFWARYISCTGPGRKISTDGINWPQSGSADYFNVAENPVNHVIAIATQATIYSSTDGATTVVMRSSTIIDNASLGFANGGFLAIAGGNAVAGSADGVTWTTGPSFSSLVGSGPKWAYMSHLGKYVFISGADGRVATSTAALGPYSASTTVPSWGGNRAIGLLYVQRLQKLFIFRNDGIIIETSDLATFTVRVNVSGLSFSSMVDVPEMNAILAVGQGLQPSTRVSLDGGVTWTGYTGLNSYRLLAWSPALARLVAIGQNVASYANATCVI